MSETRYTVEHEWVCLEDDGTITVGITEYAKDQLGDIVFAELPEMGASFDTGSVMAVVESVKTAGELNAPMSGSVIEVNSKLIDEPELVNRDPIGEGWFVKIKPNDTMKFHDFMDEDEYKKFVDEI